MTTASGTEVHTLRVDGDLGSLSVRVGGPIRVFSERPAWLPGGALAEHEIHVPPSDTFAALLRHFRDCVRTGEEPITSGRRQRRALEAVLAAYRSMETGKPVRLTPAYL